MCTCLPGYFGSSPTCRPECVLNSDCLPTRTCINQKCIDPCPGACGNNAICRPINHNAICSCTSGYTGDPLVRCAPIVVAVPQADPIDPCRPSPCGLNANCASINGQASCSCLPQYLGSPPYCRPECTSNSDCPSQLACNNMKCFSPCSGACGFMAECAVQLHTANCQCPAGYVGNPFIECRIQQREFAYI